jgi:nucleoside-diphosphate-sugar epimerase
MKVLVTGAAGFIGSTLCLALLDAGHDVMGVDAFIPYYPRALKEQNLADLRDRPHFRFVEADLRTADVCHLIDGRDVIVHEAAMPGLLRSWSEFELYLSCNVLATHRLLEAARDVGIGRFVHASTSSVYGAEAVGDEDQPTQPVSPYGVSKLAGEHLVLAFSAAYGVPAVILRYFSIYGPRQRPDMAFNRFISSLSRGEAITVYGDGMQSRSSTYVDDCVGGTLLAIDGAEPGQAYNIGGGEPLTVLDAIRILAEEIGVEPQLRFEPPRAGDQRLTMADSTKAHRDFRYSPAVSPREGLTRQVRWQLGLAAATAG